MIFDPQQLTTDADHERLRVLLDEDLRFIVVQGYAGFPFDVLHGKPACFPRVVFAEMRETDLSFPEAHNVLVDYDEAGYMAIDHLLRLGHRKIVFYSYPPEPAPFRRIHAVLKGCRRAYGQHGLSSEKLFSMATWLPDAKQAIHEFQEVLARRDRPTAVFCFQDSHAREVYAAARRLGLRIPDDLAVVGFFDTPWCDMLEPPLTSVSIRQDRIGEMVGEIIAGKVKVSEVPIMIKPSLIVRGSCGGAPAGLRPDNKLQTAYADVTENQERLKA